ncbi:MAG: bifunctional glutamate N-acetyltransferase/amino-acid acetyltransferase ArgJ [Candidatus Micrarchaeia archaeon]
MITRVRGFGAAGVHCGIKYRNRDLALIFSDSPARAAGVFTTNKVTGAHIKVDKEKLRKGMAQAILINSGNANACNGKQGIADARKMCALVASELGISERLVLCASTGIIGKRLPMAKIREGIRRLVKRPANRWEHAARAIMTTDTRMKAAYREVAVGGRAVRIGAICKGAGMICPNMATMVCIIATDALIKGSLLRKALAAAVGQSFNRISVDGDMSTNDTVIILANGRAGNREISSVGGDYREFEKTLTSLCQELARMIVHDGEGASKFIEVRVNGAANEEEAQRIAKAIANSNLVKTAVFGEDANWGRIAAAAGRSGARVSERMDITMNGVKVVRNGVSTGREDAARERLEEEGVVIEVDAKAGKAKGFVWTCDLTYDYITENAAYEGL